MYYVSSEIYNYLHVFKNELKFKWFNELIPLYNSKLDYHNIRIPNIGDIYFNTNNGNVYICVFENGIKKWIKK